MPSTHEIHRRALSAAIAVVGRHRHRAGVAAMAAVLGGGLACLPEPDDIGESAETASEATSEHTATTIEDTALSDATGMTESGDDTGAMTDTGTGTGTGGEGSTSTDGTGETADSSTGEGTTSSTSSTSSTSTGEDSSSSSSSSSTEGESGLSDCKNGDGETDWECCEAQGWEPAEHCTPWGPPAPPRFVHRAPLPRLV